MTDYERTIAVFLPNWIGDAVMATPAIASLARHFAGHRLVAVGKPYIQSTFGGAPWFDAYIPLEKGRYLSTAKAIRARTAVLFANTLRSAVIARLAGCTQVVGFARHGRDLLLSQRLYPKRDGFGAFVPCPIVHDYNAIVQRLGVPEPGTQLKLFTTSEDDALAQAFWAQTKLDRFASVIGLNPGGAFGASKHWPTAHFAEVAQRLAQKGHGVVVLCGPSEREEAIRIAAAAKHPHVVSLSTVAPSIGLTKAIVRRLQLLITTDSGPRHFAHAFAVPVVSLFGPTHIEWTETFFDKAVHLQETLPCGPCQARTCPEGHHRCMRELTAERVIRSAHEQLRRHGQEVRHAG
jgi:heptosyltransferase II